MLFGTPKRWLEDGKSITVERAPTAFGPLSLKVDSYLSKGEVIAEIQLPERNRPQKTQLRIRVPSRWKVVSAQIGVNRIDTDAKGTIEISKLTGKQTIRFQVSKD